jgi:glycine cleavage system H protein
MSKINENYLYTDTNEWVEIKGNIARVGIDDYSQNEFGEIVYVDLPKQGVECNIGDDVCVVESVKTATDICSPLSGKVIEVNAAVADDPKLINKSCYVDGWLYEIELSNHDELKSLMDAKAYKTHLSI